MKMSLKTPFLCAQLMLMTVFSGQAADYQKQVLEQAHARFRSATNTAQYAEAAQQYEYLVEEEGIRNGQLFYTLGNSWFMAGDVGRAVLNYRRAERLMPNDADLQHNLKTALEARTDLIPEKKPHPLAATLLGWHIHTPTALRWWWFAVCWTVFWAALLRTTQTVEKKARIAMVAAGILSVILLASLIAEQVMRSRSERGVIIAGEVTARKGNGNRYAPAFREPLHSGTEFQSIEKRGNWRHLRLADGHTCWIPLSAAEVVELGE